MTSDGTGHQPAHDVPTHESTLDRGVPKFRYFFVLPIVAAFVASVTLLVLGFIETFKVIIEVVQHGEGHAMESLKLHFVEVIDVFLLATILYVIAGGFYQLFISQPKGLAPWLKVDSVHDLEVMLIGVVITLLAVTGLAAVLSWDGGTDLLPLGLTIAAVIAALAFFLRRSEH